MDMAKNANTAKDAANKMFKEYRNVLIDAVEHAAQKAQKDIHAKALSCLDEYYESYSPSSYDRTDSLRRAILPYLHMKQSNDNIITTIGVEYSPWILEMFTDDSYSASKKYGQVDGDWVINNFLAGIHPRTDGSSLPGEAVYLPKQTPSATEKMKTYLDNYLVIFEDNVNDYILKHYMKRGG
jgi:hypothetical protein